MRPVFVILTWQITKQEIKAAISICLNVLAGNQQESFTVARQGRRKKTNNEGTEEGRKPTMKSRKKEENKQ